MGKEEASVCVCWCAGVCVCWCAGLFKQILDS